MRPNSLTDDRYHHFSDSRRPPVYRDGWSKSLHAGTPYGVYAYQGWSWDDPRILFGNERRYVHVLEKTRGGILSLQNVNEEMIERLLGALDEAQAERLQRMWSKFNGNFRGNRVGAEFWYYVTNSWPSNWSAEEIREWASFGAPSVTNPKFSNRLLRRFGFGVVEDTEGIIWSSEPVQSFFTADSAFRVVDSFQIRQGS